MSGIRIQRSCVVNVYYYASDEEGFSDETITIVLIIENVSNVIFYICWEQGIYLMRREQKCGIVIEYKEGGFIVTTLFSDVIVITENKPWPEIF